MKIEFLLIDYTLHIYLKEVFSTIFARTLTFYLLGLINSITIDRGIRVQ